MGNCYKRKKNNLNISKQIIDIDSSLNFKNKENGLNSNTLIKDDILQLNKQINNISIVLNLVNDKLENINLINQSLDNIENSLEVFNNKKNKNNNFFNGVQNNDFILDEIKHSFIKKQKKRFKAEIKNEIKNDFFIPISKLLDKKDKEILDFKFKNDSFNSELKSNFSIEIENLKNLINSEKKELEKMINSKINEISKNINENNQTFESQINLNLESIKKNYDSKIDDIIQQIRTTNSEVNNLKLNNESNLQSLKEQMELKLKNINQKLNEEIENSNNKHNSVLDNISKIIRNNKEDLEKLKNLYLSETEGLKDKIEEVKQTIPIELKNLETKININNKKIENYIEQFETLNKNIPKNMKNMIKKSFLEFYDTFRSKYISSKQIKQHEKKFKLFSEKNYGKTGLYNIGNTCYLNSVLQVLKNIPKFTYKISEISKEYGAFLLSLKKLMVNICKSNVPSFSPKEFKDSLDKECSRFSGNSQNDSTIFYLSLINIIHKKLNKAKKENYKKLDMKKCENKTLQEKFLIWKENYLSKNQSFIIDLFFIYFINETECKFCNEKRQIFQCANYLDFPIVSENGKIQNLEECFENYQIESKLSGKCDNCGKNKLIQRIIILELPPVLIINLKRVGENKAYFNEIEIPFNLDMSKIIRKVNNNSFYELKGFIKHSGDENSGHNYSFCKNMFNDKWYEYNDSRCIPLDNLPDMDRIFFLCYTKVGDDIDNIYYLNKIIDSLEE